MGAGQRRIGGVWDLGGQLTAMTRCRTAPISLGEEYIGQSDDGTDYHPDQNYIDPNTRNNPTGNATLLNARSTAGQLPTPKDHFWKRTPIVDHPCC